MSVGQDGGKERQSDGCTGASLVAEATDRPLHLKSNRWLEAPKGTQRINHVSSVL